MSGRQIGRITLWEGPYAELIVVRLMPKKYYGTALGLIGLGTALKNNSISNARFIRRSNS